MTITIRQNNQIVLQVTSLQELKNLANDPIKAPKHIWKLKHKIRDGLLENISTAVKMAEYLKKQGFEVDGS